MNIQRHEEGSGFRRLAAFGTGLALGLCFTAVVSLPVLFANPQSDDAKPGDAVKSRGVTILSPGAKPAPAGSAADADDFIEGNYWAFIVGINKYPTMDKDKQLEAARKDAEAVSRILVDRYGFSKERMTELYDEAATRKGIIRAFAALKRRLTDKDSLFIYYAGHGEYETTGKDKDKTEGMGYWIPTDAELDDPASYIFNSQVKDYLTNIPARHIYMVSDSCFSGALMGKTRALGLSKSAIKELYQEKSRWVLASGGLYPVPDAADKGKKGHSTFAWHFMKILEKNTNPYLLVKDIIEPLAVRVSNEVQGQLPRSAPVTAAGDEGGQFVFKLKRDLLKGAGPDPADLARLEAERKKTEALKAEVAGLEEQLKKQEEALKKQQEEMAAKKQAMLARLKEAQEQAAREAAAEDQRFAAELKAAEEKARREAEARQAAQKAVAERNKKVEEERLAAAAQIEQQKKALEEKAREAQAKREQMEKERQAEAERIAALQREAEEKKREADLKNRKAEEQRLAELKKQQEEAERKRLAELKRQDEERKAEAERQAALVRELKAREEAEKARIQEEQRKLAELRKKQEEEKEAARSAELKKQEEEARQAEIARRKAEEERIAALKREAEEQKRQAELARKKAEEERVAEERRAAELERQRQAELKRQDEERRRILAEAKAAQEREEKRLAELKRKQEEAERLRLAELKRQDEERQRLEGEMKAAKEREERRLAELKKQQEEAERKLAEEHRLAEVKRLAEEKRLAQERAKGEGERLAALKRQEEAVRKAEEERLAVLARQAEEQKRKIQEAKKAEEEQRKAAQEAAQELERKAAISAKSPPAIEGTQPIVEASLRPFLAPKAKDLSPIVTIPAGGFIMGSKPGDGNPDEGPQRKVHLDAYTIDKFEVTVAQYAEYLKKSGAEPPDFWERANIKEEGNRPVVGVDWLEANEYCEFYGKRLPTEAQWEKAARGEDGRKYPWGNDEPGPLFANYASGVAFSYGKSLAAVGSYESGKSPFGVYDMVGNVWEWTLDWYDKTYYQSASVKNPTGPSNGDYKVIRGGSWSKRPAIARVAGRMSYSPSTRMNSVGFRCAGEAR